MPFVNSSVLFTRFIDSEADLDSAIKALLPLSQSPILAYPELVRSGIITLLVGLLTHENMDIVIDVVELIYELTDEDAEVDYEDDSYETSQEALKTLIEGLVRFFQSNKPSPLTIVRLKIQLWNYLSTTCPG